MIVSSQKLRRLGRAARKKKPGGTTLEELIRAVPDLPMVQAERARREAAAEKAALPPQPTEAAIPPVEARSADPLPPAPQEPKWYEEMCRWRPREAADQYDDGVRYETIHEYDLLEWALREQDYDLDD